MLIFLYFSTLGAVAGVVFSSFFEWTLHRFLMHRPFGLLTYPYNRHALSHHRIFKADHTYHLKDEKDKRTIPMAWWNGPVLIALCQIPFLAAVLVWHEWGILCGSVLACSAYYGAYEYLHWCMHLPRKRVLERSGIFFCLNGHHVLHHRYMNRNFNVVLPLADLCFRTLLLRSKVSFRQVEGPMIPNLQPREKKMRGANAPARH